MENILGISLGTRFVGLAVLYNGELADFRIRTFFEARTKEKQKNIIQTIHKHIERYGIGTIVLKTPKPKHCSKYIQGLLSDIRHLSEQLHIKLTVCTVSELKMQYNGNARGNRQALIQAIIAKYPQYRQLADLGQREQNSRKAYHVKLFEAIACAELGLRTGQ